MNWFDVREFAVNLRGFVPQQKPYVEFHGEMKMLPARVRSRGNVSPSFFGRDWPELFDDIGALVDWPGGSKGVGSFLVDVEERPDSYEVRADVPGVDKKDIQLALEANTLTITLRQHEEREDKPKSFIRKERWGGTAVRTVNFPTAPHSDDVHAELKCGVLTVRVKKVPEQQSKMITIS